MFGDVPTNIVIEACEAVLARSRDGATINLNGVIIRCLVSHLPGDLDRCMLVGEDWSVGFNLSIPNEHSNNVHWVFGADYNVSTPGVENWDAFLRDMSVLAMTRNFWSEKNMPDQKPDSHQDQLHDFIKFRI